MKNVIDVPQSAESYNELLQQAVSLIESGRCFAAKQVNTAVTRTRWAIGQLLYDRKIESGHGDRIVDRLSSDLKDRYPGMGMSPRQLWSMKRFYLRYSVADSKLLRSVAVLPWSHNLVLLSSNLDDSAVMYYAHESVIKHWNRDLLFNDINKPIGIADYQLIGSKEDLQRLLCDEIEAYEMNSDVDESAGDCTKEIEHCIKDSKKQKALMQISRKIYHCIENDSRICVSTMAKQLDLSVRQLQYHLKTLQTLKKIARVGGRKLGEWKIIDKNYPAGFGE